MSKPRVLVLDNSPRRLSTYWFGKWFRQIGCHISAYNFWQKPRPVNLDNFDALVVSGSPASARQDDDWILQEMTLIEEAGEYGMPVLGVCFGAQLLARTYYGKNAVRNCAQPEIGWYCISQTRQADMLFEGVPQQFFSFQFHAEEVIPQPGMEVLASSPASQVQAFRVTDKPVWGTQFHFEVTPRAGRDLLRKTGEIIKSYGFTYQERVSQARPSEAAPQLFHNFLKAIPDGRSK